jgi:hypothetical protein
MPGADIVLVDRMAAGAGLVERLAADGITAERVGRSTGLSDVSDKEGEHDPRAGHKGA